MERRGKRVAFTKIFILTCMTNLLTFGSIVLCCLLAAPIRMFLQHAAPPHLMISSCCLETSHHSLYLMPRCARLYYFRFLALLDYNFSFASLVPFA